MSHQFVAIFCATIGTGRPLGLPAVSPAAEFVVAEFVAAAPVMHKTISGLTYSHCHPVGGRKCIWRSVLIFLFLLYKKNSVSFVEFFGDESTQEPIPQAKTSRSFPAVQPVSLSTYHLWACMVGPEATGLGHTLTKHGEPTIHLPRNNKPCSNAFPELS